MRKFAKFVTEFYSVERPNRKFLREGQALMTFLNIFDTEEYNKISSLYYYDETNIDCFYIDELIGNTLVHLMNVWENHKV